jgi:hypothetical protein
MPQGAQVVHPPLCRPGEAVNRGPASRPSFALAVVLLLAAFALSACGDDPYSGTWTSTGEYTVMGVAGKPGTAPSFTVTIERSGDGWTVSGINPDYSYPVEEVDGKLVRTDEGKAALLELRGDNLILLGPAEIELSKQ